MVCDCRHEFVIIISFMMSNKYRVGSISILYL